MRPVKQSKMTKVYCALAVIVLSVACGADPTPPPTVEAVAPVQRPTTGKLETSKGILTVPGPAYMDGRDTEAQPPLTVMSINVWDAVPRRTVTCSLPHGAMVDIAEATFGDRA